MTRIRLACPCQPRGRDWFANSDCPEDCGLAALGSKYRWSGAQGRAGRVDGGGHRHAAGDGLRPDRRHRSAIRSVLRHRHDGRGLGFRLVVAPYQRAHQRHFAGCLQRPGRITNANCHLRSACFSPARSWSGPFRSSIALFKLGDLTRYISESVVLGFMAGAGCLMALSQVHNLLGLEEQGTGHHRLLHRLWLTLTQDAPGELIVPSPLAPAPSCWWCRCRHLTPQISLAARGHAPGPGLDRRPGFAARLVQV